MSSTFPVRGMQRILAGSVDPEIRVTLLDQDGDATQAVGTLTCSISRADGTIVATDRATASDSSAGAYTCQLTTAEASPLDVLTATWRIGGATRATSYHRTVGGYLFSIDRLAQRAGMQEFDMAALRTERDRVTDLFERCTGVAWNPQYDYDEREAPGRCHVITHRPLRVLRSMTIDGAAQTVASMYVDQASGIIDARFTLCGRMTIGVEHGFDQPTSDLRDAALTAAADRLLRDSSTLGSRTRSMTNDLGVTQQFSYAGKDHPTGIDEVDAVLADHDFRDPAVA